MCRPRYDLATCNLLGERTAAITEKPELAPYDKLRELCKFEARSRKGVNLDTRVRARDLSPIKPATAIAADAIRHSSVPVAKPL
jgi:hypothetical protein